MAEGKIYAAISQVMADVGAVGKNDVNNFDKYKFRGIDAVMNALSPAMVKNHVFVTPQVLESTREERASQKGGTMIYTTVTVRYTFYTDDGSSIQAVVIGEAMDRSDKSTNKAMSAAFKYACFQTFCIPTEEMRDADTESPDPMPKDAPIDQEDPTEIPSAKITKGQIAKIQAELKRTGVKPEIVCQRFHVAEIADLTESMYPQVMDGFAKTPDRAA